MLESYLAMSLCRFVPLTMLMQKFNCAWHSCEPSIQTVFEGLRGLLLRALFAPQDFNSGGRGDLTAHPPLEYSPIHNGLYQ
jgi:hypothetical protein